MASTKIGFLDLAAHKAHIGMKKGQGGPFGAVIVRNGKVVAIASNSVLQQQDPTRHAEMNCISIAARKLRRFSLSDCEIYSTTEPCPMCFSAIHWAQMRAVTYSTSIGDVQRLGFNELTIPATKMKRWGKSSVQIRKVKNDSCQKLLSDWTRLAHKQTY